jgi:hypothetical protein
MFIRKSETGFLISTVTSLIGRGSFPGVSKGTSTRSELVQAEGGAVGFSVIAGLTFVALAFVALAFVDLAVVLAAVAEGCEHAVSAHIAREDTTIEVLRARMFVMV